MLEPSYVVRTTAVAWECLRRIVAAEGSYTELITTATNMNDTDENNNE